MPGETDGIYWFSEGGQNYSLYRPEYARELAGYLAKLAIDNQKALDVGRGTGHRIYPDRPVIAVCGDGG
ncbi:hypothetical protein [Enterobacter sp.]|uniref:hypothetical protein n=1 Tax=Enterobacter sp. TaxID=42895 RepID=UPI003992637E